MMSSKCSIRVLGYGGSCLHKSSMVLCAFSKISSTSSIERAPKTLKITKFKFTNKGRSRHNKENNYVLL